MQKIYLTLLSCFIAIVTIAQTPGFSYQAVILNPDVQSLPGNDVEQGLLSESDIAIRFTIENSVGIEYQETHTTKTDAYGMVHLMVGQGTATLGNFTEVAWIGAEKYLKVEIDFTASGASYESLDRQALTYLPQPLSLESNNRINDLELAINAIAADLTTIELTPGPQGPIGLTGPAGANGVDGSNGVDGAPGATGPQGPQGPAGADGQDGQDGAIGPQGPAGADGADGQDGAIGPQGPQGPQGPDGPDGQDGAIGPQGPAGADGQDGQDGAIGPQGPQGPAGADGADGQDGAIGPQGPAGADGQDGQDGAIGPQGPQGPAGIGIAQTLTISGDTLFITSGNYIILPPPTLLGCTDSTAINYNSLANTDDGSCIAAVNGCTERTAFNYNALANTDDGSCRYFPLINDTYGGGIIFWLDENGGGLIAAPSDQGQANWGCFGTDILGAEGTDIGDGNQNTIDIEAGCTTPGTAADICANLTLNGYNDWFLPSTAALNKMYLNIGPGNVLGFGNVGGFANYGYWSSNESNNDKAWGKSFGSGNLFIQGKDTNSKVRAVRAF